MTFLHKTLVFFVLNVVIFLSLWIGYKNAFDANKSIDSIYIFLFVVLQLFYCFVAVEGNWKVKLLVTIAVTVLSTVFFGLLLLVINWLCNTYGVCSNFSVFENPTRVIFLVGFIRMIHIFAVVFLIYFSNSIFGVKRNVI